MDRLTAELQRLYFFPDQRWRSCDAGAGEAMPSLDLVGPDGGARTMVVEFERAADWPQVAGLYQGVQEDLDLPAPAVSVSGLAGYGIWFSLAAAVPADQAEAFLAGLQRRYLAELPASHLRLRPTAGGSVERVPALHGATGKWSAFIDPAMGSMFIDEPGLEMEPNLDKQADLLSGLKSIGTEDFRRVLNILLVPAESDTGRAGRPPETPGEASRARGRVRQTLNVGGNFSDPKSFLLAVMNDPSASAGQRIRAAKALLPYFERVPK